MKKLSALILLPLMLLSVFYGCTPKNLTFNYSSKDIDKLVYNFDSNKAAPREMMDITGKEDIDRILDEFGGITFEITDEVITTGIIPLCGYKDDKQIFAYFYHISPLYIGKTTYLASPGQETKLAKAEENIIDILNEFKSSGKYQVYTR